jgi:hypothetical protein
MLGRENLADPESGKEFTVDETSALGRVPAPFTNRK